MKEKCKITIQERKHNARLYIIYKMCSWDLLFYYAIAFIFLVQTKGMGPADVMFTDAIYPFFKMFLQMPGLTIIDKIGKKNSLILANLSLSMSLIVLILSNGIFMVIISYLFMAFSFCIKNTAESNLLYDSVPDKNGKGIFSKIEEKGERNYYYLDGITSIFTGFLFVINGYIPMMISLMFTVIAISLSTCFKEVYEPVKENTKSLQTRVKDYIGEIKSAFQFIFQSKRLQAIMAFIFFFEGLVYSSYTLRESLLNELEVEPQIFAMIIALLTILSGFTTKLQSIIHKKLKNKALTFIGMAYVITFVLVGVTGLSSLPFIPMLAVILSLYGIQYALQSPYGILNNKYLKSFATPSMRTKIATTFDFIKSISSFLVAMVATFLLEIITPQLAFLVLGITFAIILIIVLYWMKDKFGLKPEEYSSKDIQKVKETIED